MDHEQTSTGPRVNGNEKNDSVADQLKQESERLRALAGQLERREARLAEIEANYPHFERFVYAKLREEFLRTTPELPDKDLESIAADEGGVPLEGFIEELERLEGKPDQQ